MSPLKFRTNFAVCIVCPKCLSVVKKDNSSVLHSLSDNKIPEDMSPLMIGTTGKWADKSFEIVGRIKYVSGSRYTNQWVLAWADGSVGWLGEGYGFYSMLKKDSLAKIPASFIQVKKAGQSFKSLENIVFYVDNIVSNNTFYCEGELPEEVLFSKEFISIESTNSKLEVALIDVYSKTEIHFYSGKIVDFQSMHFTNLRDLNGWI
jgi:hypothetical protein